MSSSSTSLAGRGPAPVRRLRPLRRSLRPRWAGAGLVALVAAAALLPLALATFAFGRDFRTSETARVDARLTAATQVAADRVAAADSGAVARARELASSRPIQLALLRHDTAALARASVTGRWLSVTVLASPAPAPQSGNGVIAHTVSVVSGGTEIGVVRATVRVAPLLAAVRSDTGTDLALVTHGAVARGDLRGIAATAVPAGTPAWVRIRGASYRAVRARVGGGLASVADVPARTVDSAVRDRQLRIGGAGVLTVAAIGAVALLLVLRRRRSPRTRRGARSPMALLGDVVAAAADPRALLPVLLETAVGAVDAAGGSAVWDGEAIAETGFAPAAAEPLRLELDDAAEDGPRQIVLFPRRGSFSAEEREVAASLIAEGRIALENARLHNIVRRQAVTDELTDLANRRRFMEVLRQEVARARRFDLDLSLVIFDLDHFKQINDRYGHQTGDEVLREAAAVIRARVRETDLPARIGGEEFAVVLSGTDVAGAAALAENLRVDLSTLVHAGRGGAAVTASFGVAELPEGGGLEELIGAADRALYRAKARGRNRVDAERAGPASSR